MLPGFKNPFAAADRKAANMDSAPPVKQQSTTITDDNDPNKSVIDPKTGKPKVQAGDDPLMNLESLWQPNTDKDGKVIPDETDTGSYMPALDQKKLKELVEGMNFTDGVSKEEMEALKAGGEDSVGAMMNMLNRAGRKSFLTAFQASSKLAEQGFTKAQERFMKGIPGHVRDMMVDNQLGESLPIMQNPMFAPLVSNVKSQFLKKYPKASPGQVKEGVNQYFKKMQEEFTKGDTKNNVVDDPSKKLRQGDPTADFEAWLGDEANLGGLNMFKSTEEDNPEQ